MSTFQGARELIVFEVHIQQSASLNNFYRPNNKTRPNPKPNPNTKDVVLIGEN